MGTGFIDPNIPLKDLVEYQRKRYKKFIPVRCYLLNKEVAFTYLGFQHLHMKRGHRRSEKDARIRLMLMEHVPSVITQARFMKKDVKKAPDTFSGKDEIYYELYSKVGPKQVSVVCTLRQIGNGALHFYGIRYKWKKTT